MVADGDAMNCRSPRKPDPRDARARVPRWRTWLAALGAAAASACRPEAPPAQLPPAVTVATPVRQAVTNYLEYTGNTAASDSVTLVARVEGYLEQVHFADGARVHAGDVLFTIQPAQYQAQLAQAEAQVAAQKAAVAHATTELARYSDLVKKDSAPQTQVDRWAYERDSSLAALHAAEAQVELAQLNLSYTRVTAPFDGRIGRHLVDPGNVVGGLGQPANLAEIDKTDPLYVYFTIDERDLLALRAHYASNSERSLTDREVPAAFGLLDEDGYPHQGRLDFASLSVAPRTGTLQVRGIFPNPDPGVLPGLFARVRIANGPPREALVIPGEAIAFDQLGEYVLLVATDGTVSRRAIKTGAQLGDRYVVEDGLAPTDTVVVAGLARAIPGRKVRPEPPDSTPADGTAAATPQDSHTP
jgi:RND family efflux transporter MFP subunit